MGSWNAARSLLNPSGWDKGAAPQPRLARARVLNALFKNTQSLSGKLAAGCAGALVWPCAHAQPKCHISQGGWVGIGNWSHADSRLPQTTVQGELIGCQRVRKKRGTATQI